MSWSYGSLSIVIFLSSAFSQRQTEVFETLHDDNLNWTLSTFLSVLVAQIFLLGPSNKYFWVWTQHDYAHGKDHDYAHGQDQAHNAFVDLWMDLREITDAVLDQPWYCLLLRRCLTSLFQTLYDGSRCCALHTCFGDSDLMWCLKGQTEGCSFWQVLSLYKLCKIVVHRQSHAKQFHWLMSV